MRHRGRTDDNQVEIVKALREFGASVLVLSSVGKGCPDLLVAYKTRTLLMEVKNPAKIPSQRKQTPDEQKFAASWQGELRVVETVAEALACL